MEEASARFFGAAGRAAGAGAGVMLGLVVHRKGMDSFMARVSHVFTTT
jgi:hypothetical protein